jgi:hypothetical protein
MSRMDWAELGSAYKWWIVATLWRQIAEENEWGEERQRRALVLFHDFTDAFVTDDLEAAEAVVRRAKQERW